LFVLVGQTERFFGGNQTFVDGGIGKTPGVDPLTVIGYLHHHLSCFVPGIDPHGARWLFACAHAFFGGLHAMVYGVTDHVGKWIRDALNQGFVHRDILALDVE